MVNVAQNHETCTILKRLNAVELGSCSHKQLQRHAKRLGIKANLSHEDLLQCLSLLQDDIVPDQVAFTVDGLDVRERLLDSYTTVEKRNRMFRKGAAGMLNLLRDWEMSCPDVDMKLGDRHYSIYPLKYLPFLHQVYMYNKYDHWSCASRHKVEFSTHEIDMLMSLRCLNKKYRGSKWLQDYRVMRVNQTNAEIKRDAESSLEFGLVL